MALQRQTLHGGVARRRGRPRVRDVSEPPALQRAGREDRRSGGRAVRARRSRALAEDDRACGDVAGRCPRPRVCRRLAREGLRLQRANRQTPLVVRNGWCREGRSRGVRQPALRRVVRRPRLRIERADGPADLARVGTGTPGVDGDVLRDARRRIRARVHRLDRPQGLFVRCDDGQAALVVRHGQLRLLVPRRVAPARVHRLSRRAPLLLRRGDGKGALALRRARRHLRLSDGARRRRLLLHLAQPNVRTQRAHRQAALASPAPSSAI